MTFLHSSHRGLDALDANGPRLLFTKRALFVRLGSSMQRLARVARRPVGADQPSDPSSPLE